RRIVLFIAQMLAHLGFQRPLQHRLGQLFEQTVFPDDLLGALIVLQQLIDQRLVDSHESFSFSHGRLHSYFYSPSQGSSLIPHVNPSPQIPKNNPFHLSQNRTFPPACSPPTPLPSPQSPCSLHGSPHFHCDRSLPPSLLRATPAANCAAARRASPLR